MNYTYTIDGVAVNPTGTWEIEYHQNEGQIFWRRILRGELTFKGVDYDYIRSLVDDLVSVENQCTYIDFVIYCDEVEFWTGRFFYPYSFHIDEDSCFMTGTPEVYDEYSCILQYYETEWHWDIFRDSVGIDYPRNVGHTVDVYDHAAALFINLPLCYWLQDIIFEMLSGNWPQMDCIEDTKIKSSFLWNDDFPNGDDYATYYGTNNYVTGFWNYLQDLNIIANETVRAQFSGAPYLLPYTVCGDEPMIGFKMIEEWLRERFNAYWYIDQNGDFRIEHISFFLPGFAHSDFNSQVDLSTLMSGCHSFAERKNKYKHLTDKLYDQERWEWEHYYGTEYGAAHDVNFQGTPIFYGDAADWKSDCVFGEFKEKISSTPKLSTDIEWWLNLIALPVADADFLNCDGYYLLDIDVSLTPDRVTFSTGIGNGAVNRINANLSTANLMYYFHQYNRIFLHGTMNDGGSPETNDFETAIKIKLQDEIEYPNCCDEFDPMKTVTTELGEGSVHAAIQTQYSVKIQLKYD